MKTAIQFDAEDRTEKGKGAARAARRGGRIPAIIYGKGMSNVDFSLEEKALKLEYLKGGFYSKIVTIKVGKDEFLALPKQLQLHPVTDRIEHADFLRVDEKSEINVWVPVRFINQERCVGIKRGGALNVVRHEVELVCNINNIPDAIEVDILDANIGDSKHISEITLPEGVRPAISDRDFTIATIAGRAKQAETAESEGEEGEAAEGEESAAASDSE